MSTEYLVKQKNLGSKQEAGLLSTVPCIVESLDMSMAFHALRRFEKQIVCGLTVEWRIELDKINTVVRDVMP